MTDGEIITEVILPNLPQAWKEQVYIMGVYQKATFDEVMTALMNFEYNDGTINRKPPQGGKYNGKRFTNECQKHGGQKWADCRSNPVNRRKSDSNKREKRGGSRLVPLVPRN